MPDAFDPGYGAEPWRTLCAECPGADVYPPDDFRVEWGPIFHRGRLDGTARVLVIGQDPAQHEAIVRRILVGEAGHRLQGFLWKLGIDRSYVLVNAFLYPVYGQGGGDRHADDARIAAYRHRWLAALLRGGQVQAVLALGALAETAWQGWLASPEGAGTDLPFARITHPTQPESSSEGDPDRRATALATMLANWNAALGLLGPAIEDRDDDEPREPYGVDFVEGERRPVPLFDLPAGVPSWMGAHSGWAERTGATPRRRRRTIAVTVPSAEVPT